MNAHDENGVKNLLRQALPPVEGDAGLGVLFPASIPVFLYYL
jgi:hypothetical protein